MPGILCLGKLPEELAVKSVLDLIQFPDWVGGTDYMKEQKYSYSQRIGKTTFIVNVKQSESAKKPLNTVFQDICKHEVLGGFFTDKSFNLENPQKVS